MMQEFQELKKEKQLTTIKSKLETHEKLKGIPKSYYSEWAIPENENDLDTFAEKVVSKYGEFKQESNNEALLNSSIPGGGIVPAGDGKTIDPAVKQFVEKNNKAATTTAK